MLNENYDQFGEELTDRILNSLSENTTLRREKLAIGSTTQRDGRTIHGIMEFTRSVRPAHRIGIGRFGFNFGTKEYDHLNPFVGYTPQDLSDTTLIGSIEVFRPAHNAYEVILSIVNQTAREFDFPENSVRVFRDMSSYGGSGEEWFDVGSVDAMIKMGIPNYVPNTIQAA